VVARRAAVWSCEFGLDGLDAIEARLQAHLDGLVRGAYEFAPAFERISVGRDPDTAFVAAATLLTARTPGSANRAVEMLNTASPEARPGIVEALCYFPLADEACNALESRLTEDGGDPFAIEILSFHRRLRSARLGPAVRSRNSETRKAAATALGRIGGEETWVLRLIDDPDTGVQAAALHAASRRGFPWALARLRGVCQDLRQASVESIWLLVCLGDRSDLEIVGALPAREDLGEAALAGLATLGYVESVELALEWAGDACLARAAGSAFRRITGLEVPVVKVSDGPEIEELYFEDLRPVPDADAARALWRQRAAGFDRRLRWRNGAPIQHGHWKGAPHHGDLRTRREELTRLWAQEPDLFPDLELEAPADRQRAMAQEE